MQGARPGVALEVKNSRGAPLEVQNGTQQDLNKMIDLVNFGGQKDRPGAENGGQNRGAYLLTLKEGVPPPGSPVISCHGIDLVFLEYSNFSIRRVSQVDCLFV